MDALVVDGTIVPAWPSPMLGVVSSLASPPDNNGTATELTTDAPTGTGRRPTTHRGRGRR